MNPIVCQSFCCNRDSILLSGEDTSTGSIVTDFQQIFQLNQTQMNKLPPSPSTMTTQKPINNVKSLQEDTPIEVKEQQQYGGEQQAIGGDELNAVPIIGTTTDGDTNKQREDVVEHIVACMLVQVMLRAETFNVSLGSDEICYSDGHSFNLTYNVPLSRYMIENQFQLMFM